MRINVQDIVVGERGRKEYGDLTSLERSIKKMGVLQPIGITKEKELIFGGRRLRACQNIGMKEVPVRVFDLNDDDPSFALQLEREENEHRKDLTVSEKTELAMRIETASTGRRGSNQYVTKVGPQNFAEAKSPSERESRDIAAKAVGMNRESYRQSKAVLASGNDELVAKMDSGELSVHAAYQALKKLERYTCPDCEEKLPEARWHCWVCHEHVTMDKDCCPRCRAARSGVETKEANNTPRPSPSKAQEVEGAEASEYNHSPSLEGPPCPNSPSSAPRRSMRLTLTQNPVHDADLIAKEANRSYCGQLARELLKKAETKEVG